MMVTSFPCVKTDDCPMVKGDVFVVITGVFSRAKRM